MSARFTNIYIHLVWGTKYNRRTLDGDVEPFVHDKLFEYGRELDLQPLAAEGAWDHVHSFFEWNATVAVADAVQTLKSKIAVKWNEPIREGERDAELLDWRVGYGAVSTGYGDVDRVIDYIDRQKERHRDNETWKSFERLDTRGRQLR